MHFVVDTHVLVWFFEGNKRLSQRVKEILEDEVNLLVIPSIVLAEIKYLCQSGRISVNLEKIINVLESDTRCTIYPLDLSVIEKLPLNLDIHDGIICATALVYKEFLKEEACLVTKDEKIIKSGLIK